MLAYLQFHTSFSGTSYESPCWQLKVGVRAALDDIKSNHPNDLASLIFFFGSAGYSKVRVRHGKRFHHHAERPVLSVPLAWQFGQPVGRPFRPYITEHDQRQQPPQAWPMPPIRFIPKCRHRKPAPQMAFMMAFNEFGLATTSARTYTGRRNAAKVVIF